jgi:hypothetical protein
MEQVEGEHLGAKALPRVLQRVLAMLEVPVAVPVTVQAVLDLVLVLASLAWAKLPVPVRAAATAFQGAQEKMD